jgi:ribosome-associated protein
MSQQTRQHVAKAVIAVESKKAEDVVILEMDRNTGAFTDYFILCSGANPRQIQAIADEVDKQLGEIGVRPSSREGYNQAEWILLDYVDFVVHIFSERARKFYDLERLWKSAKKLKPADLLKPAAKKIAKKAAAKKVAPKKPAKRVAKRVARRAVRSKPGTKIKVKSKVQKAKRKR